LTTPPIASNPHPMFRESFQAVALIISLTASTVASAKETSRVDYYPVTGRTAPEVYEYIKTKSPRVAGNATFAFTLIATKTDKRERQKGEACSYSSFKTSALYAFNIPRHSSPKALPASTRGKWSAFTAYLKTHEEGHRTIWRACFQRYDAEALALTAKTCKSLDKSREKLFTKIKRDCLKQDEAYDTIFRRAVLSEPFVKEALARKKDDR
jgi:predicted secreted Zn-dependent protease